MSTNSNIVKQQFEYSLGVTTPEQNYLEMLWQRSKKFRLLPMLLVLLLLVFLLILNILHMQTTPRYLVVVLLCSARKSLNAGYRTAPPNPTAFLKMK